jgi:hypothetical protein
MLTNADTPLWSDVAAIRIQGAAEGGLNGLCTRVLHGAGQLWCGLFGHHVLLRYQPERLSLECSHCGYQSPGWELGRHLSGPSVHVDGGVACQHVRVYTNHSLRTAERIHSRQTGSAVNRYAAGSHPV